MDINDDDDKRRVGCICGGLGDCFGAAGHTTGHLPAAGQAGPYERGTKKSRAMASAQDGASTPPVPAAVVRVRTLSLGLEPGGVQRERHNYEGVGRSNESSICVTKFAFGFWFCTVLSL